MASSGSYRLDQAYAVNHQTWMQGDGSKDRFQDHGQARHWMMTQADKLGKLVEAFLASNEAK